MFLIALILSILRASRALIDIMQWLNSLEKQSNNFRKNDELVINVEENERSYDEINILYTVYKAILRQMWLNRPVSQYFSPSG